MGRIAKESDCPGANILTGKTWQYVRDSIWSAARRDAFQKRDFAKKSGEGAVHWNEVKLLGNLF